MATGLVRVISRSAGEFLSLMAADKEKKKGETLSRVTYAPAK